MTYKTATYKTEHDENANEVLYMVATIRNGTVELDWVHDDDDQATYAQRVAAQVEAIANADASSIPRQTAILTLRLRRQGDVRVSGIACADEYREEAARLANEAALDMYDSVYPDVAVEAQAFVDESIEKVKRLGTFDVIPLLEAGAGRQLAADRFLPYLLDQAKSELEKTSTFVQRIGWLVNSGMALFPCTPPLEKYRYFRAVSEVARRVNADAVVYLADGYQLSLDGKRTGDEVLSVTWINRDGTCVSTGVGYTRSRHPQLKNEIITFSRDVTPGNKSTQNLVPAWGSYRPD